jgi:predicted permease
MRHISQDIRFAIRAFRSSPIFTVSALTVLALGVGLNAATFSLFDAVVLRPLPAVARPTELVDIEPGGTTYPSYVFLRDGSQAFSGLAAWSHRWLSLAGAGEAERIRGAVVSSNYFDVLGVPPEDGRFFVPREEESGDAVAVISHALWQRRFEGKRRALGASVVLNGAPFTVVGVAPRSFRGVAFGAVPDLWIPVGAWPRVVTGPMARLDYHRRSWGWLSMFGRLRPGVGLPAARASVTLVGKREAAAFPEMGPRETERSIEPLSRTAAGAGNDADPVRLFGLLLGAVGIVLVIACANLANLLLARAAGRRREIAIRQALGAGRARLVQQLLTESLLLALAGGAAGVLVASWSIGLLTQIPIPGGRETFAAFGVALDARVLAFAMAVSLVTGVLFGLAPALRGSRIEVLAALKDAPAVGTERAVSRGALVAAQVALCLVLLSCAGLFVRSLRNALSIDLGFEPRGVALASVHLGLARYDEPRARQFARELSDRVARLPGVRSVAWTGLLPLSGGQDTETVAIEGAPAGMRSEVDTIAVGPGYFSTLGLPILAGREFQEALDLPAGPGSVVINEAAARRFWPGRSPLGRRLEMMGRPRTVVGVMRDSRFRSFREVGIPLVAADIEQLRDAGLLSEMTLAVRAAGDPRALLPAIAAESARIDPGLPIFNLRTLEDAIGDMLLPQRLGSTLLGLFALISFLLAQVGVYAIVAGNVARRRREFGIRMALGSRPAEMRRMVLRQTSTPLVAGAAIGLLIAFGVTRLFGQFLYGIAPTDVATLAAALLILLAGGLAAADLPARRATRVDPMEALRNE